MADDADIVLPRTADEVVALVDKHFPERCPEADWNERQIWIATGSRIVARFLLELQNRRNENVLATT